MGVYVERNIYSRTWNCTITKQIHASCAILFITKKKSRAHPKISRARAQSIWTMKLKINNPVVGMGTNNRRGNVFELKLSWSFLYFFNPCGRPTQTLNSVRQFSSDKANPCCWSSNAHHPRFLRLQSGNWIINDQCLKTAELGLFRAIIGQSLTEGQHGNTEI